MIDINRLRTGAKQLSVNLDLEQLEKFTIFAEKLHEENAKFNLVGDSGPETILVHHFLDSLSAVLGRTPEPGERVLDIGSGAGLPGLALAIAYPGTAFVLLDSSKKKTKFLDLTNKVLGLRNVEAVCGRAEETGRQAGWRDAFDIVTARAVAPLPILIEYALPFIKTGGTLVAQRGPKAKEEAAAAKRAIKELRGSSSRLIAVNVPYLDAERQLVIIEKMGATPGRYPRRTGVPLKRPL